MHSQKNIAIIGAGAWGTTIANILAENAHNVSLWVRTERLANIINSTNENQIYLPGIKLSNRINVFTNLKKTIENKDIIFLGIPSQYIRDISRKCSRFVSNGSLIVNLSKGIEEKTYKRMSEVIEDEIPNNIVASLSGPNHSIEVAQKKPTATVISSKSNEAMNIVKDILSTDYFKVYPHDDIIGVEICGAVKNIPAIASGIIGELNYGDNTKASVITLGLAEMNIIGMFYGAKRKTVYGLAGVGDLVVTCTGTHSRNQYVGRLLAKGKSLAEIKTLLHGMVAEGIETTKVVYEISQKHNLKMPLTIEVYNILYNGKRIDLAMKDLLERVQNG